MEDHEEVGTAREQPSRARRPYWFELESPTGSRICGVYDMLPITLPVTFYADDDGLCYDFADAGADRHWDGAETQSLNGEGGVPKVIAVDEAGDFWLLRECRPAFDEDAPWQEVAYAEGWDLFQSGAKTQLERVDVRDAFGSDLEATLYVIGRAARDGDGPHWRALEAWCQRDPKTYASTIQAIVDDLPQPNMDGDRHGS